MKKNMNENITTTQKYEKHYHNAKKYEKPEKYEKYKIYWSGREAGETPAALAAPTENRIIVGLTPLVERCGMGDLFSRDRAAVA